MPNRPGDFIWYELSTPDPDAAARFYGAVLGWTSRPFAPAEEGGYRLFEAGGEAVGGLTAQGCDLPGSRPLWLGYVGVADVDAMAADFAAAGGHSIVPPMDLPGVGRLALLADPQGVPLYVMRGASEGASAAFDPARPGHCHWNELSTPDPVAALAFHGARFGWAKEGGMPMGEMGEYSFLAHGGRAIGAMMRHPEPGPPPAWTFYFGTADIDAAAVALREAGGQVMYGPAAVPGGVFIVVAADPQGALFGLVGPRR